MPKPRPAAPAAASLPAALLWAALFAALALVPDEKLVRLKLISAEAGVALLLLAWAARLASAGAPARRASSLDKWPALYAACAVLFYAIAPDRAAAEPELARALLSAGAYWAALQTLPAPAALLPAWAAAGALAGGYALLQRLGSLGPLQFPQLDRPFGTFGNPIFLGTFLAASLPAAAALALESLAWVPALVLAGSGLWLTQSRAAFAGLAAAVAVWALARLDGKRRAWAAALLAAGAAVLLWSFRGRPLTHGLIWSDTLGLWRAFPWLGCGLGRFHLEFPAYASDALKALWPQQKVIVNFAHNEYLQVLAETGPLGLLAFAAVPAALAWRLWRDPRLPAAPAVGALTLFAAGFASPDLRFGVSSCVAFAALGAAAAGVAEERPVGREGRAGWLAAAAVFLAAFATLSVRPLIAHRRLLAEPAFHIQATPEVQRAAAELEAKLKASPGDADLAENLAYLYAKEQAWSAAVSRFELVTKLDPSRPGPYNNLGNISYLLGERDKAVAYWEKSLSLQPDQLDAHLNLGKLYYEQGKLKDSSRHLKAALALDPQNAKARVLLRKMVE